MVRERPLVLTRVVLPLLGVSVLIFLAGCGRLDQDAVAADLRTLESSTGEGMLVAEQAARSRTPADFVEIRAAELSKQSKNVADALAETPTEHGFQEAAMRGNEIGNRASELLDSLHSNPGDAGLATNVAAELRDLHRDAGDAEESL